MRVGKRGKGAYERYEHGRFEAHQGKNANEYSYPLHKIRSDKLENWQRNEEIPAESDKLRGV